MAAPADMQATAELQVIPLGQGVSVRAEILRVVELLHRHPELLLQTHASGTNIQGPLETILRAVEEVHQALHHEGVVRLVSYLKIETRTDKTPTLAGKRL